MSESNADSNEIAAAAEWVKQAGRVARDRTSNDHQVGYLQSRHRALDGMVTSLFAMIAELRREIEELKARPVQRYMGVWSPEREYQADNQVTFSGGLWVAKGCSKGARPGKSPDLWQLCVKRGGAG